MVGHAETHVDEGNASSKFGHAQLAKFRWAYAHAIPSGLGGTIGGCALGVRKGVASSTIASYAGYGLSAPKSDGLIAAQVAWWQRKPVVVASGYCRDGVKPTNGWLSELRPLEQHTARGRRPFILAADFTDELGDVLDNG